MEKFCLYFSVMWLFETVWRAGCRTFQITISVPKTTVTRTLTKTVFEDDHVWSPARYQTPSERQRVILLNYFAFSETLFDRFQ